MATQPGEPYSRERYDAVRAASAVFKNVDVVWLHRELPQDPDTPGFWDMWKNLMGTKEFLRFPVRKGDYIVSSEAYGQTLADLTGGVFMPYDPNRELLPIKATPVRDNPLDHFNEIIPEFQKIIRKTVTIFGAESTGKTTLSKILTDQMDTHWIFEWARPYLETVGPEITIEKMHAIWHGQAAVQRQAQTWTDKPFIVQDTDLFSTIGYWEQPHWKDALGPVPEGLIKEAQELKSDLYIIPASNIPFEPDEIRYGVDKRESPDEFWIEIAEKYNLKYIVLDRSGLDWRYATSRSAMRKLFKDTHGLTYDRKGF